MDDETIIKEVLFKLDNWTVADVDNEDNLIDSE